MKRTEKNKHLIKEEKKALKEKRKEKRKKKVKRIRLIIIVLIIITGIYGFLIEPNMLKINEYKIESNEISKYFHGLKIIQFSDLHYGTTINKSNINKIIKKINSESPDVIIFTGDLIDNEYKYTKNDIKTLKKELKDLNAKLGKYAVVGNHDYYNEEYENILNESEFMLLKNNYDTIYYKDNNPILIYGLEDIDYGSPTLDNLNTEEANNINFKILILHEGDYISKIKNNDFDIIMAGHSHNGQVNIIKPIYLPYNATKYYKSYYEENNTKIFISNGIGTSKFPIRINSIPSINLYRLTKKDA